MSAKENVEVASRIFREYGATIRSMVKVYVPDEHDADDICQDIFLSIAASPPSHETALLAYLKTVVRNHVRDSYRRAASRQRFAQRYSALLETTNVCDEHRDRLERTEQAREAMELLKCALPPYMARVVIERCVYGGNVDQIASKLGIERRTVSRYCCVGLRRLRNLLDK